MVMCYIISVVSHLHGVEGSVRTLLFVGVWLRGLDVALQRCGQDSGELGRWDSMCCSIAHARNVYTEENWPFVLLRLR